MACHVTCPRAMSCTMSRGLLFPMEGMWHLKIDTFCCHNDRIYEDYSVKGMRSHF